MKIVLSPSKTKTLRGMPDRAHLDEALIRHIVEQVRGLSVDELGRALKLKPEAAASLHDFYRDFDALPEGAACESYDGIVFKYVDWPSLSEQARRYGDSHLVIMSALYGVLEPHMGIRAYRLDAADKVGIALYNIWSDAVRAYFQKEDWILNLASKEYAKMIDHDVIVTVEFWENRNGAYKQLSTSSKISRGMMARYCLEHEVNSLDALPPEINGFRRVTNIEEHIPTASTVIRYEKEG